MPGERRAGAGGQAERVNAAADLLEAGVPAAEADRVLAGRFGVSARQARRYADQARVSWRAEGPRSPPWSRELWPSSWRGAAEIIPAGE